MIKTRTVNFSFTKGMYDSYVRVTVCRAKLLLPGSFFKEGDSECVAFFIEQICEVYIKCSHLFLNKFYVFDYDQSIFQLFLFPCCQIAELS